jgi:hypothetical protein
MKIGLHSGLQRVVAVLSSIILLGLGILSCSFAQNIPSGTARPSLDPGKLDSLLLQIDPWPEGSTDYSPKSWRHLLQAAKYVQECDPASVRVQLAHRQSASDGELSSIPKTQEEGDKVLRLFARRLEDDGKLLLLMRVIFDIPENERTEPSIRFYAWRMRGTERNSDGTVNLAWPISWNGGNPKLISGRTSLEGVNTLYNAAGEYDYFRERYPLRALKDIQADASSSGRREPVAPNK